MKVCKVEWSIYLNEQADEQIHDFPDFRCAYVHELQNFFKLKKIDFKIVL